MVEIVFDLYVAALLAAARCDSSLDSHLMVQGTEERLELCDCPVVGLGRRGYRLRGISGVLGGAVRQRGCSE